MNFWEERWHLGQTGWHNQSVNDNLQAHASTLFPTESPTIFVPLCGKTLDMGWLAEQGAQVIGVDLVEKAIHEFFTEREESPKCSIEHEIPHFKTENITLLKSDIFNVTTDVIGPIDAIFDRAALVALTLERRQDYVNHCLSLLKPGGTILLITYDSPVADIQGPPFPVRKGTVESLYTQATNCELLAEVMMKPEDDERLAKRGLAWSRSDIWKITK